MTTVYQPIKLAYDTEADLSGASIPNPATSEGFIAFVRETGCSYQLSLNSGADLSANALATHIGGDSRWLKLSAEPSAYRASPYVVTVTQETDPKNVDLMVFDYGTDTNGVIVFLPGAGANEEDWQYQTKYFKDQGYRTITVGSTWARRIKQALRDVQQRHLRC